jgi:hypothetical protein
MGLSYEKEAINYAYFHASNHNLIALFRRLGDGVLRIGGGSVDQISWTPDSEGATHAQVSPANRSTLHRPRKSPPDTFVNPTDPNLSTALHSCGNQ